MCGHDGHTAILAALGRQFGRKRPARGRVVLMFQPAEETGNGAAGVVADPRFGEIAPDFAFSLHNMPGVPFGDVRLRPARSTAPRAACASAGGQDRAFVHARNRRLADAGGEPADARVAGARRRTFADDDFGMVTVTHAPMGEAVFGIRRPMPRSGRRCAPGGTSAWPTCVAAAEALVARIAGEHGLSARYDYREIFVASVNAPDAVEHLRRALDEEGILHAEDDLPMRASEDSACSATAPVGHVFPRCRRASRAAQSGL